MVSKINVPKHQRATGTEASTVNPDQPIITLRSVLLEAVQVQDDLDDSKKGQASVANHLFTLAKERFTDGKTGSLDIDMFDAALKAEEAWIKSTDAGTSRVDALPRCWTQAKSNIRRGHLDFNLKPVDYVSEGKFREALNSHRRAKKDKDTQHQIEVVNEQNKTALSEMEVHPDISGILASLANMFEKLPNTDKDIMRGDLIAVHSKHRKTFQEVVGGTITKTATEKVA